jgi:hypothetical protein
MPFLTSLVASLGVMCFRWKYLHDVYTAKLEYYGALASVLLFLVSLTMSILLSVSDLKRKVRT